MDRILVIDDDPIFVKATTAIRESHGYKVDSAQDGDEGLAKMKERKPDLVLLDVMMDWVLDGVTVSREMMSQEALRRVPIIMCTSIRNSEYREVFPTDQYLHIDRWVDKPCPPEKLVSEVETTLKEHRKYRELS
jgi:CheY-like chemotaxis protein